MGGCHGRRRAAWIADAGPGSVFRPTISANNDTPSATNLFWTNHDDLVFPWEKSGWLHLYAVPVQGGTARALTAGKFEVTHGVFSQDRKRLVYSSTQDDADRSSLGEPIDGRDANRRATESSPIATIDQWNSPVLLVQADDDRIVPFQQAAELIEGLRSHNIDHDVIMIPNEIHDMARYSSWMLLFNAAD